MVPEHEHTSVIRALDERPVWSPRFMHRYSVVCYADSLTHKKLEMGENDGFGD